MIRINLLPQEYRRKARTPIRLLLGLSAVVAVNAGLASWWGWTVIGVQAEVESQRAALQMEFDALSPQVRHNESLDSEKQRYESRERTLAGITASRISWTRKLDELVDVVNQGGDGQRHLVWLDDLQVSQTADPNSKSYGTARANGHSGSDKFAQVANFLEDLERSSFIDDFLKPSPPEGSQTLVDETLVPPVAWSFPLALTLRSPDERAQAAADRAARAKEQPADGASAPETKPADGASAPEKKEGRP